MNTRAQKVWLIASVLLSASTCGCRNTIKIEYDVFSIYRSENLLTFTQLTNDMLVSDAFLSNDDIDVAGIVKKINQFKLMPIQNPREDVFWVLSLKKGMNEAARVCVSFLEPREYIRIGGNYYTFPGFLIDEYDIPCPRLPEKYN